MNNAGTDITGQVVILAAHCFVPEHRGLLQRMFRAEEGFGCFPDTDGTAIFGYFLLTGAEDRVSGAMVERLATKAEVEAIYRTIYLGPDGGPCPGCGAGWINNERNHPEDCRYLAIVTSEV